MDFEIVETILEKHDADQGAAESHGIAVGMLCIDIRTDAENWLQEIFDPSTQLINEDRDIMLSLFQQTTDLLNPDEELFEFDLFLPDQYSTLTNQAEAIRNWCQGFLFGIGYKTSSGSWPGECDEIMRDVVEITRMETEISSDEDENLLMEIHEYLRSAVLLIKSQLLESQTSQQTH